ncbi:MAG: Sapep family Mn(2+)-dependent dipeptidase [Erysipelotrichaceae bacterium]|nr:Sapep family Mn(2+)-dependent dipeptidase [Erysipelotrichaceae bacterium]
MGEVRDYFLAHLDELKELLAINSVYDKQTACESMPYGLGVARALDYMRQMALRDGFEVLEYDNQAIAIRRKGESHRQRIDIASHLDVVEVGDGWSRDPFKPEVINGRLYGRGTSDMKTAAFQSYLVLKKLTEDGVPFVRELRIVLGSDEERTMNDMFHYVEKAGLPDFAFTPDGRFPMAIGEKGALMWHLRGKYQGTLIRRLDGGVQCNVIPPVATVQLDPDFDTSLLKESLGRIRKYELKDHTLTVYGKQAHCSIPWAGHSATTDLLYVLKDHDQLAANLYEIFASPYGEGFGYHLSHGLQKSFTTNLGILRIDEDGTIYSQVDGRYPYQLKSSELTEILKSRCIAEVSLDYDSPPTNNSVDDPYIRTLLKAYRKKTWDFMKPFVSGGVSYSKVFGHCVAFGPKANDLHPTMAHQADEYIRMKDALKAFEIYYEAIRKLVSEEEL